MLVTLGYHRCPMLCGLVLDGLVKAQRASGLKLGKDFSPSTSASIPTRTPSCCAQTQKRVARAGGRQGTTVADWPFWSVDASTAARRRARSPTRSAFATSTTRPAKQFAHAAVAFVLTPEGVVARYLYGVDFRARDFRMALVEAERRSGRDLVRQGAAVLLPVRPGQRGGMRRSCMGVHADRRRRSCFFALAGLLTVLWRKELAMKRAQTAGSR